MKFCIVNKSTTVNKVVLHIFQRNITHRAEMTHKTNKKLGIFKVSKMGIEKSSNMH